MDKNESQIPVIFFTFFLCGTLFCLEGFGYTIFFDLDNTTRLVSAVIGIAFLLGATGLLLGSVYPPFADFTASIIFAEISVVSGWVGLTEAGKNFLQDLNAPIGEDRLIFVVISIIFGILSVIAIKKY